LKASSTDLAKPRLTSVHSFYWRPA
jgi:hypothetical protein